MVLKFHERRGEARSVLEPCGDERAVNKRVACLVFRGSVVYRLYAGGLETLVVLRFKQRPHAIEVAQMPVLVVFFKLAARPLLERAGFVEEIRRELSEHIFPFCRVGFRRGVFYNAQKHIQIVAAGGDVDSRVCVGGRGIVRRIVFRGIARQDAVVFVIRKRRLARFIMNRAVRVGVIFGGHKLLPVVRRFNQKRQKHIALKPEISPVLDRANVFVRKVVRGDGKHGSELVKVDFAAERNFDISVALQGLIERLDHPA